MNSSLLALLLVTLPGRPETLCRRLSSSGTRGMVSERQQRDFIRITEQKENQVVIRAFLERVALNQVCLIDHNTGLLKERNGVPV